MTVFKKTYGFIKPTNDAHTLGMMAVVDILEECNQHVVVADERVGAAAHDYKHETRRGLVMDWIIKHHIDYVGFSYRLDEDDAVNLVGYFLEAFKVHQLMFYQGGPIEKIFFAGLPLACQQIKSQFGEFVVTFMGGESMIETLQKLGVNHIPQDLMQSHQYDQTLLSFGKQLIESNQHTTFNASRQWRYPEAGSIKDGILKRIKANQQQSTMPLLRAHVGPYDSKASKRESLDQFKDWLKTLAQDGSLDILSIGSSQLTQSHFNQDWTGLPNGGGVPIQTPSEFEEIYRASRPMLVRTYAGTRHIPQLAKMYDQTIYSCWHALSLWWFNKLDERGPYDLYTNLKQHIETISYLGLVNKPFEANVSHHFAFRGADDITYLVSNYLAAKLAKSKGVQTFICQNMLNTPRVTWGIHDLAKSRAMLALLKTLEDDHFNVILQPRAGLDYFKPDLHQAKIQLAAISAMMDDIDPANDYSPPLIHVVSYSEASFLATPEVIIESSKITQAAIASYRNLRKQGHIADMSQHPEVLLKTNHMISQSKQLITAIESLVDDVYSPEGFYTIFASGFLPVPYLYREVDEFRHAKNLKTKPVFGGVALVDQDNQPLSMETRLLLASSHLQDAKKQLHNLQLGLAYHE